MEKGNVSAKACFLMGDVGKCLTEEREIRTSMSNWSMLHPVGSG